MVGASGRVGSMALKIDRPHAGRLGLLKPSHSHRETLAMLWSTLGCANTVRGESRREERKEVRKGEGPRKAVDTRRGLRHMKDTFSNV